MLLLLSLGLVSFGLPACSAEVKIGVVEPQKVFEGTKAGKKIKDSLDEFVKARQRLIDSEEEALKTMQADLTKQEAVLSKAAKQEKQLAVNQKLLQFQQRLQQLNVEVQTKRNETLAEFTKKIEQVVLEIAEKEKIVLVVGKGDSGANLMIFYSQPSINLTDRVIKALDDKGGA
jgi:Skp family chaperone for outer membrane proteins